MTILAIDTSAKVASVALLKDRTIIGEMNINAGHTHSQTLMPAIQSLLSLVECSLATVEAMAIAVGPGSFTGLRIGIAAVKGMAQALDKPCIPVSTLAGLAYNCAGLPLAHGIVLCPVMDARCGQVYNALYDATLQPIVKDRAISIADLAEELSAMEAPVLLVGDGAQLCYDAFSPQLGGRLTIAPPHLRLQRAASVGLAADIRNAVPAAQLIPQYNRQPQAVRLAQEQIHAKEPAT